MRNRPRIPVVSRWKSVNSMEQSMTTGTKKDKVKSASFPKIQGKDIGENLGNSKDTHIRSKKKELLVSPVRTTILGIVLLTVGALGFYYLPGMISDDADGSRIVNSFYCSTMTLTTYVILRINSNQYHELCLTSSS